MRSDLQSTFTACYRIDRLNIQISRPVAYVLVAGGAIDISQLRSHNIREWQLKHDRLHHRLTHNVIEHTQKFGSDTATDSDVSSRLISRRNSNSSEMNTCGDAENIASHFQQGVDHLSIHSSSSCGKMTDSVNHVSTVNNPCR